MDNDAIKRTLEVLEEVTGAMTAPNTLDDGLRLIVDLTCKLLDTAQAAVLLLDEGKQLFIVQAATGLDSADVKVGFPLVVPQRMQKILLGIQHIHRINWVDAGLDGVQFPIITVPLYYHGNRIGLLFAGGARNPDTAEEPLRMKLFSLMAPFAALIIENARATDIINHRFTANIRRHMEDVLMEESQGTVPEGAAVQKAEGQLLAMSIRNPAQMVRLLTEAFYQELKAAGFDDSNVTIAAAHLVSCIIHQGQPPRGE